MEKEEGGGEGESEKPPKRKKREREEEESDGNNGEEKEQEGTIKRWKKEVKIQYVKRCKKWIHQYKEVKKTLGGGGGKKIL